MSEGNEEQRKEVNINHYEVLVRVIIYSEDRGLQDINPGLAKEQE